MQALEDRGALANSMVIFTSDNGYLFGEHRLSTKVVPYEESIRVPLLPRYPGVTAPRTEAAIVLNNDLAPTIAELLGVVPGLTVDGRSLVPLLEGTAVADWRSLFLIEGFPTEAEGISIPAYQALRSGPTALYPNRLRTFWNDGALEYHDLILDPYQLSNPTSSLSPQARNWANQRRAALGTCAGETCRALV